MSTNQNLSRRQFITTTTAALAATQLPGAEADAKKDPTKLALEGGEKTVKRSMPKRVRWGDPERQQLDAAVKQDNLLYWKAPQTTLLTSRFSGYTGLKHVMTCSSGTAALHIAVATAGIGPGDEVITTPFTDIGTVIGVLFQQGVPVFADLEPNTYHVSARTVEPLITPKTKAIIAVHLGGNPSQLTELKALADKHKLILIEDCAQAWGAQYQGKSIGTVGHIACFSLQQSKHITCGDGGVVASNDERFGPLLHRFGDKGADRAQPGYLTERLATNYRMNELSAAFAAAQFTRLEEIAAKRSALGSLLTNELEGVVGVTCPKVAEGNRCTYWHYMLRIWPDKLRCTREQFVKACAAEGAGLSNGYIPVMLHQLPMFKEHAFFAGRWPVKELGLTKMDYNAVKLPEAEAILKMCSNFALNEAMDEDYVRSVAAAIKKVAKHFAK